jgi:hypothetical protein
MAACLLQPSNATCHGNLVRALLLKNEKLSITFFVKHIGSSLFEAPHVQGLGLQIFRPTFLYSMGNIRISTFIETLNTL